MYVSNHQWHHLGERCLDLRQYANIARQQMSVVRSIPAEPLIFDGMMNIRTVNERAPGERASGSLRLPWRDRSSIEERRVPRSRQPLSLLWEHGTPAGGGEAVLTPRWSINAINNWWGCDGLPSTGAIDRDNVGAGSQYHLRASTSDGAAGGRRPAEQHWRGCKNSSGDDDRTGAGHARRHQWRFSNGPALRGSRHPFGWSSPSVRLTRNPDQCRGSPMSTVTADVT